MVNRYQEGIKRYSAPEWSSETTGLTWLTQKSRIGQNSDHRKKGQPMRVLPLSEVKTRLSELVNVVEQRDEEITITRNGKPVAVLISADEYASWKETVQIIADAELMQEIRDGIQALQRTKKRYTLDDLFVD
jgi:prevent-host-death family protein